MTGKPRIWMRSEARASECRAPIVPADAGLLTGLGIAVTVEESSHRVFPIAEYAAAGCAIAKEGSWTGAPADQYIVGLKELPDGAAPLMHRHVYFGHAYKRQQGSAELLGRFAAGGGELLDLESLADADGRRLAAFGYWAGYVGAALAVLSATGHLTSPLRPLPKETLDSGLRRARRADPPRVLVVGALGRCGSGARDALAMAGIAPTCWDVDETRDLDRTALLGHDILVNTVFTTSPITPFVRSADLGDPARRLTLVADVTCDVTSSCNALPIYESATSWQEPVRRLCQGPRPLDIIAIDNLPSLLPKEASVAFSAQLVPHLMELGTAAPTWQRCVLAFRKACHSIGIEGEKCDV